MMSTIGSLTTAKRHTLDRRVDQLSLDRLARRDRHAEVPEGGHSLPMHSVSLKRNLESVSKAGIERDVEKGPNNFDSGNPNSCSAPVTVDFSVHNHTTRCEARAEIATESSGLIARGSSVPFAFSSVAIRRAFGGLHESCVRQMAWFFVLLFLICVPAVSAACTTIGARKFWFVRQPWFTDPRAHACAQATSSTPTTSAVSAHCSLCSCFGAN